MTGSFSRVARGAWKGGGGDFYLTAKFHQVSGYSQQAAAVVLQVGGSQGVVALHQHLQPPFCLPLPIALESNTCATAWYNIELNPSPFMDAFQFALLSLFSCLLSSFRLFPFVLSFIIQITSFVHYSPHR